MEGYQKKTGTTIVAIKTKNGIVVASDRRATMGLSVIAHKNTKKIIPISKNIVVAAAGTYGDFQFLAKILEANIKLRELKTRRTIIVKEVANLLSAIMYGRRVFPYFVEIIVAGKDSNGYHLYILDPIGTLLEEKYYASGSGMPYALGIVEAEYREDMSLEEAKELAIKAVKASIERDPFSGDGIEVVTINGKGMDSELLRIKKVTAKDQ